MFFDTILLNTQHGGRFGIAWLAATRGLKFVTKKQIKELNIIKLCEELELFIISHSTSPRKRFSLRLSAILINGAVKIFREQATILQGEIYLTTTRVRSVMILDNETGILETPPTPIPKVKPRRGKKLVVTDTPDLKIQEMGDIFLQLPNVEDILRPLANTEEISIRENLLVRHEQQDDFGLGILSREEAEEELHSLLVKTRDAPSSQPQYPSSDSVTPQTQIEVVAQVHASKGSSVSKDKYLRKITTETKHLRTENDKHSPIIQVIKDRLEHPTETREHLVECNHIPVSNIETLDQPIESAHALDTHLPEQISQIQAETETRKNEQKTSTKKSRTDKPILLEVHMKEAPKILKVASEKSKLFVNKARKIFVRINRCDENEGQFTNEKCPLPGPYRNILNEYLFNIFWFENKESIIQVRAHSSIRSASANDSLGLRRRDTQRSTMEKQSISDVGIRPSVLSLETQMPESTPSAVKLITEDIAFKQTSDVQLPASTVTSTPRKRKRLMTSEYEEIPHSTIFRQPSVSEQIILPHQPLIPELPVKDVQPAVTEQLTVTEKQVTTLFHETVETELEKQLRIDEAHDQLTEPTTGASFPLESHYKKRQQHIVNIVVKWTSDQYITLEDICEKPINRLNVARAFSDLLTLAANRFLLLISEEDSLELKFIKKGPKLQKT